GESAIGILLVAILPTVRNLLLAKDFDGTSSHFAPPRALPIHFLGQSTAGRRHCPFATQEGWNGERFRARNCRAKRAPFSNRPADCRDASLSRRELATGHD